MSKWFRRVVAGAGVVLAMATMAGFAFAGPKKDKTEKAPQTSVDATFDRYLLTPHGTISGLLLKNGNVVRAHGSEIKDTSMKSGDVLHIDAHAKTSPAGTTYFRPLVKKNGVTVVDATGPHQKGNKDKDDAKGKKLADITSTSTITTFITGPKGKVAGVVLADGTVATAPHHGDLGALNLKKGDSVTMTGPGGSYALGRAMKIRTVKLPNGDTKTL